MKKSIIAVVIAAIISVLSAVSAYADPVIDDIAVDPIFTVVIPFGVELTDKESVVSTIRIYGEDEDSAVVVNNLQFVKVDLTYSDNDFEVVNEEGDGIAYTVNDKNSFGDLTNVANCLNGKKSSTDIVFKITGETLYPGSYFDTLTFDVSVADRDMIDIGTISGSYKAKDGDILTGIGNQDTHIIIEDGAEVLLKNCDISTIKNDDSHKWAGVTLEGNAAIMIEGENVAKGGQADYSGIYVPADKTLTITGKGSLEASSNGNGAGIGSCHKSDCGNIVISDGNITAIGGTGCAGIGSTADKSSCGNISILGGTVSAVGGQNAAGIGTGTGNECYCGNISISGGSVTAIGTGVGAAIGTCAGGKCGNISIASTVTKVEVTKGESASKYIGAGDSGTVGEITIEDGVTIIEN